MRRRGSGTRMAGIFRVLGVAGAVAAVLLASKMYLRQYVEMRTLLQERARLSAELRRRRDELRKLERRNAFLASDEGVERMAREKLKYVKPGELMFVVKPRPRNAD